VDRAQDYENMVLERRAIVRTAEGGRGALVSFDLVQLRIVESSIVDSPIPSELRGQAMSAVGSAAAALGLNDNVDQKKKAAAKSLAASLFDGAIGIGGF
jgi:hypothetical protein